MQAHAAVTGWPLVGVLLSVGALAACGPSEGGQAAAAPLESGGQEEFGHYELVEDWPRPLPDDDHSHLGWTWGSQAAVYAESPDRIWLGQRGELRLPGPDGQVEGEGRRFKHVLVALNREGEVVEYWKQHDGLFEGGRGPHKIKINPYDPEKHVWVVDDNQHVIFRFTYEGELVKTMGERGVPGDGPDHFNRPTDIAWLPDGTFFVSDGYGNTRVVKFDADGNYLMSWGTPPVDPKNPRPNELKEPHSIAVSSDRRVYVADRGHRRFQVFDEHGTFLFLFGTGLRSSPFSHVITEDGKIVVGDGGTNRILLYDLEGHYLYGWGAPGRLPGQFGGPHSLTVDQEGNLYVAEVFNGRVQKFRPRPNADPLKIAAPELRRFPVASSE